MTYLILQLPPSTEKAINYRGTQRSSPAYLDNLSEDSIANRLWAWYVEKAYHADLNEDDLITASEIIAEYRNNKLDFEVIEIRSERKNLIHGKFLGYDLSYSNHESLLSAGNALWKREQNMSFLHVLPGLFGPSINCNGLFQTRLAARMYHTTLKWIQQQRPNSFEPYLSEFEVIAVGEVRIV